MNGISTSTESSNRHLRLFTDGPGNRIAARQLRYIQLKLNTEIVNTPGSMKIIKNLFLAYQH